MGWVRSFVIDHKQVAKNKRQRGAVNKILPYRDVNNVSEGVISPFPFFGALEATADTAGVGTGMSGLSTVRFALQVGTSLSDSSVKIKREITVG